MRVHMLNVSLQTPVGILKLASVNVTTGAERNWTDLQFAPLLAVLLCGKVGRQVSISRERLTNVLFISRNQTLSWLKTCVKTFKVIPATALLCWPTGQADSHLTCERLTNTRLFHTIRFSLRALFTWIFRQLRKMALTREQSQRNFSLQKTVIRIIASSINYSSEKKEEKKEEGLDPLTDLSLQLTMVCHPGTWRAVVW